ncbi:MAG: class aminotransferase [Bryobacterales bacterium]|nr:class aminotransferase [Bryobacterales bacterium]
MVYLDNNATTMPLPEVIRAVADAMERVPGNPSSVHCIGTAARRALETARQTVATGLGAEHPSQIVFTSSGTESINTAFCLFASAGVSQIVTSTVEHSAVSRAAGRWSAGRAIVAAPVSSTGALDLGILTRSVSSSPSLVSVAVANNETGVITDVHAVARICRKHGALLHLDAVQAVGKMPFRLSAVDCDAASFSAHKFHGPPGCGILFLRSTVPPEARAQILLPGHQERGLRGGTENLPAAIGTAVAIEALNDIESILNPLIAHRDRLEEALLQSIPDSQINGSGEPRLSNTISLYCPRRNAADLVLLLSQKGLAVSSGAACTTGGTPSHVIQAMGFSQDRANSTLRLSLSRFTTLQQVDEAVELVADAYSRTLPSAICC